MTLSDKTVIGCIGCGHMGGAILGGFASRAPYPLYGYDAHSEALVPLTPRGVRAASSITELVRAADLIITAVKPHQTAKVLREAAPALNEDKLVLSVAAGVTLRALHAAVDGKCPVVRAMPNTPALVGAGVFALCFDDADVQPEHKRFLLKLFATIGLPLELPEAQITAFSALVGAGPAYAFYVMDALVRAGMTMGFTGADAKRMVLALMEGSVHMAAQSPHSLGDLMYQVCSPAGITIDAVNHLERNAAGQHLVDAVLAAYKRGKAIED